MLRGKKILLGVCGSIAAYKTAVLTRLLIKEEAEVQVVMTSSASDFITPLTLSTLSKKPVLSEFKKGEDGTWNNHVDLALSADLILIAPASANSIAKFANGICDNLLSAIYFSAKCPVIIAPAMDLDMMVHPAIVKNIETLQGYGVKIIESEYGELASGLSGKGRMAEPEHILQYVKDFFSVSKKLSGKKVLITAGPTREAIDPVRFISNHSTGKMGFELAKTAHRLGAAVTIISGPVSLTDLPSEIKTVKINTAEEMYNAAKDYSSSSDIVIFSAAVADYTPAFVSSEKIKKKEAEFNIVLKKTVDIAGTLGKSKKPGQIFVGFALETNDELKHAQGKLTSKNLDMIVLNSLNDKGAGFGFDTNKITILDKDNNISEFELKNKSAVASDIFHAIEKLL